MFGGIIGIIIVFGIAAGAGAIAVSNLLEICEPSEVLVFSGKKSGKGYEIVHSGKKLRIPLFHKVDRLDVTNMVIDLNVSNAYSKGGIPLSIKGVANVKIASHQPLINNAVERFLGMTREQISRVAKETLEGNLRGVLARLTPEQVNNDRQMFAEELSEEAEHDLSKLGLSLDTLKIQSVTDDKGYLDSIGRKQSATLIMNSRIAEAENRAEAAIRDADNQLKKATAKINAQKDIAKADAERRILDAKTRAEAMVAEEQSRIGAAVAKAQASLDVQRARLEQVKRQLAADVIQPAQARKAELEAEAKGNAAKIIEDGKANVAALQALLDTWRDAGDAARPIFMLQQFDAIMDSMMSTIQDIDIDKITVIDSNLDKLDRQGSLPMKAASGSEQVKQTLGLDLPRVLQGLAAMNTKES
ncbi:flotillin family protein [Persicimonas caeni]|jgi:flotillin|uniref:Flotillin family protein n=1 Tax=Persicimonas caeni TaxID=2292766 RepID=A0A4Y6Q2H5_PERCE|nr:flotillin family protein [Persicimonas caeni]QDG54798.1 flotillin family protein [Persicimonas caeni]QED36019.1 flotillin family protein [Persicimonas caeni]